jgi:hypothetical protein
LQSVLVGVCIGLGELLVYLLFIGRIQRTIVVYCGFE